MVGWRMALFRRGRDPEPPDETFAFFTRGEAERFRAMVRATFAENGLEVTAYVDHVVDATGRKFGLGNIAAGCRQADGGERAWPAVIGRHVVTIVRSMSEPSPIDSITREQLCRQVYPRLQERSTLPRKLDFDYARPVAGDIVETLNLDLPESVIWLTDSHLRRFAPLGPVVDAAWQNLRAITFETHEVLKAGDASFHCVMDLSMFTATAMLILDDVAARIGEPIDPELGAFVVVPFRHQLAFHVWRGDGLIIPAVNGLVRFAQLGFDESPGPLSPHVFWWRPSGVEQLTSHHGDRLAVNIGDELGELLVRLRGG
jgi:hypothetical protein